LNITLYYLFSVILFLSFLFSRSYSIDNTQKKLIVFFLFFLLDIVINNEKLINSTVLHAIFFLLIGFISIGMLDVNKRNLIKINKIIIGLYFGNVIVSVLLSKLQIDNFFTKYIFLFAYYKDSYRYLGFASEPSYLALVITMSILSIFYFHKDISKKNLWTYLALYVVSIILSQTTFGYLCIVLVLAYIYQKRLLFQQKNNMQRNILLVICLIMFLFLQDNIYLIRLQSALSIIFEGNSLNDLMIQLNEEDSSAAFRILPTFRYIQESDISSIKFWIGYGVTGSGIFFSQMFGFEEIHNFGFFPAFLYSFGILGCGFFLFFIFSTIKNLPFIFKLFLLISLTNCNISTQMFWFIIIEMFWISKIQIQQQFTKQNVDGTLNLGG
jgi:hypothetical protein